MSRRLALALVGYGVVSLALATAVVNGDGVGYLKQIPHDAASPGHLGYLPVARAVSELWGYSVLNDLIFPLRLLSVMAVLGSMVLLYDAGRRLYSKRGALFSAALMGASFAVWRASHEVESYALGLFAATGLLWALVRMRKSATPLRWAAAAGTFAAASVLFHLTLALLALPLALALWWWSPRGRRWQALLTGGACMALGVFVPLLVVVSSLGKEVPGEAFAWLLSADHGVPYPLAPWTPLVALWGLARSLAYAPYPYEASLGWVIPLSVVASALLLALAHRVVKSRHEPGLEGRWMWAWCVPLMLFAVYFFPSDTERWIFCIPPLALYAGRIGTQHRGWWIVGAVALVNVATAIPAALDTSELAQAKAVESVLQGSDLLVAPGHGWEELVGLGMEEPPDKFLLIFEVGAARSRDDAVAAMHASIEKHLSEGGRVYVARLEGDSDPRGFKELEWFDMTREDFTALFSAYSPKPAEVSGLWEL